MWIHSNQPGCCFAVSMCYHDYCPWVGLGLIDLTVFIGSCSPRQCFVGWFTLTCFVLATFVFVVISLQELHDLL